MAKVNGIRIQKVLSENGVMSRRKAEEAIAQGRVTVNGHPAQPGNPVDPARDVIAIDGVRVQLRKKKQNVYIMLHKPRGFVTTTSDELGRRCVTDLVKMCIRDRTKGFLCFLPCILLLSAKNPAIPLFSNKP